MKTSNNQKEQAGSHKQMSKINKFIRLSLLAFAILFNHSLFSQTANDSINKVSADSAGVYANKVAGNNPDVAKAKADLDELERGYKESPNTGDRKQQHDASSFYVSFSMGAGELFHKSYNGLMNISVPYTSTDLYGHTTNAVFTSSIKNPFSQCESIPVLASLEFGFPRDYFIALDYCFTRNLTYASAGFGYQVNLGNSGIVIKPSINLGGEGNSGGGSDFGNIDNVDKTISILGNTSNPTFKYETGGGFHKTEAVDNTQYIEVDYSRNCFIITPRIGIGNDQYDHRFHWEFDISYNIMVTDKGGIQLTQCGQDATNLLTKRIVKFGSGYSAYDNNHTITSDPNPFNSFSIGFIVGYNTNELTRHWGHSGYGRGCYSLTNSKCLPPIS